MTVKTEFPRFDSDLPVIDGFVDTSYHHDACPSLTNKELALQLFVDYANPDLSEYPAERKSGDVGRFQLIQIEKDGEILDNPETYANTDDLDQVLAAIAKVKNTSSFAP